MKILRLIGGGNSTAFTLAEVLITLGVVGVVSALTIPTLVSNYREKVIVTRLNAVYNQLQQATARMVQDENGGFDNIWGEYPIKTYYELLPKYIKVTEVKRTKTKTCCKNRAGTILGENYGTGKMYTLPNGAEIILYPGTKAGGTYVKCNMTTQYNGTLYFNACGEIVIDVDGFNNGRNIIGYDVFKVALVKDGLLPVGMPRESVWTHKFDECLKDGSGYPYGCTAWVIQNKNMDYLHCPDKLGWNKQSSCK